MSRLAEAVLEDDYAAESAVMKTHSKQMERIVGSPTEPRFYIEGRALLEALATCVTPKSAHEQQVNQARDRKSDGDTRSRSCPARRCAQCGVASAPRPQVMQIMRTLSGTNDRSRTKLPKSAMQYLTHPIGNYGIWIAQAKSECHNSEQERG